MAFKELGLSLGIAWWEEEKAPPQEEMLGSSYICQTTSLDKTKFQATMAQATTGQCGRDGASTTCSGGYVPGTLFKF